jgi:hypothetical protein
MIHNHKGMYSIKLTKTLIKFVSGCKVFEYKFSKFVAFHGNTHTYINTYVTAEREEMY